MSSSTMTVDEKMAGATRRGLRLMMAGVVLAVSATVALSAWAQPRGHHGGAMGGPGLFMGSPERIDRGVDHLLDGLNATDAQRSQIKQIARQAADDLKGQRETARTLRDKSMQIFTAPTVDAAAAESVRQQMLAQHDASSRRMLQAMLDISRVLTPEQRAKVAEHVKQRQQRMQERMQREHPQK
ncbi:Spy/CpxP family protein refolding chaperone [Piscinibacter sp. XHJ-5]|uniref:Spy/CpxP family protein refolding chaperone n=1 Tax=Piscinibacter sp. XHJ-5 TaxID=3037797 RepID=UPI002452A844|nr:Spy/CpxP family protein refolding chaperone [Piscinibacter sp. XHJ-5]